jgi:DNA-directed RNA polymerase subunit L
MKKPRLTTSADVFRRQGNPWVSRREGIADFGRNPDTEDAEYDFSHRFSQTGGTFGKPTPAKVRVETVTPRPVKAEATIKEQKQKILARMNQNMAKHTRVVKVPEGRASLMFHPCGGCRKAACIHKGMCLR